MLLRNGYLFTDPGIKTQLLLGYNEAASFMHSIRTRHLISANNGNAIDFYLWKTSDDVYVAGTNHVASLTGTGLGIFKLNPEHALDVNGNGKISGSLTCGFVNLTNTNWGSGLVFGSTDSYLLYQPV